MKIADSPASMSAQVTSAIDKQNAVLRKTVFKMKQILATSTRDPVKIQVAKQKVKQARLKAERDYLRTCLGDQEPEKQYAIDTASRISDLLARKAAEAHAKKHRTPPTDSDGLPMAAPTTGPNTMLRKISSKNRDMSAEEQEMERTIAKKQAEIEQKRMALAAKQAQAAADRQAAETERQAAAATASAKAKTEAAQAVAAAETAAAAASQRRQADATTAAQAEAIRQATAEQAELAAKRAAQSSKLEQLLKEEQELQRAAEAEESKKSAHQTKLAEAQAHFEAKRAAEEEERSRRKRVVEDAARREAELKVRDAAARAVREEEAAVSAAPTDHDLAEWHGTANTAAEMSPQERMRQIEEAERQAIAEMDVGSANNNDDAILEAMKKTNPEAYAQMSASRQAAPDAMTTKTRAAKQQLRNDLGIGSATLARNKSPTKVALADADYLLSMITSGADEDSELKDLSNGARYHVNMEDEKVYRMSDLPSDELDDYMSLNGSTPGSPAPASDWGTTTMERRKKNLSDVERRKGEAEKRKQEAWERSMSRSKGKKKKSRKKGKVSETPL